LADRAYSVPCFVVDINNGKDRPSTWRYLLITLHRIARSRR